MHIIRSANLNINISQTKAILNMGRLKVIADHKGLIQGVVHDYF